MQTKFIKKKLKKSSKQWVSRQRDDKYVKLSKKSGYRSRAAFKLLEIDEKFKLLKHRKRIVDLGSAPGSWSQIAVEKVGAGNVIAFDLLAMDPIEGVRFFKLDVLSAELPGIIQTEWHSRCDVILSDLAPNTTGDPLTDCLRISSLLEGILEVVPTFLRTGGAMISKIFQGGDSDQLLKLFKNRFSQVSYFKPDSSRKESREIYIIATKFHD